MLADARVDPTARDNGAMIHLAKWGETAVFKLLLEDIRVDPGCDDYKVIRLAAKRGATDIVRLLMADPRVDFAKHSGELLTSAQGIDSTLVGTMFIAVIDAAGNKPLIQLLLSDPRTVLNAQDNVALQTAVKQADVDALKTLLASPSTNPAANGNMAIRQACRRDTFDYTGTTRAEAVRLLLQDARVDPAVNNNEPLRNAAGTMFVAAVELLLKDPRVDAAALNNEAIRRVAGNGFVESDTGEFGQDDPYNRNSYQLGETSQLPLLMALLADSRVNPAANDNESIRRAAYWGN